MKFFLTTLAASAATTHAAQCDVTKFLPLLSFPTVQNCVNESHYTLMPPTRPTDDQIAAICRSEACKQVLVAVKALGLPDCEIGSVSIKNDVIDRVAKRCGSGAPGNNGPSNNGGPGSNPATGPNGAPSGSSTPASGSNTPASGSNTPASGSNKPSSGSNTLASGSKTGSGSPVAGLTGSNSSSSTPIPSAATNASTTAKPKPIEHHVGAAGSSSQSHDTKDNKDDVVTPSSGSGDHAIDTPLIDGSNAAANKITPKTAVPKPTSSAMTISVGGAASLASAVAAMLL